MKEYSKKIKKVVYMSVCETETVHSLYGRLAELTDTVYTPSQFASDILKRQFPNVEFPVLHHYASPCVHPVVKKVQFPPDAYVFYHIGNVIDHRKNIHKIIEAFMRLQLPNCFLLLKATCNQPVPWKNIPNIVVLEGLMSHEELEGVHAVGDCYVSCSHSEGAGMGAIEAAMRHKPVIIQEYGAAKEYIDTPYIVTCGRKKVGVDDFLYTADMEWGDPDFGLLMKHMKHAYENKVRVQLHPKTYQVVSDVPTRLVEILLGQKD
jgi:glycosyltransferase involved in cell wall biosynthesis